MHVHFLRQDHTIHFKFILPAVSVIFIFPYSFVGGLAAGIPQLDNFISLLGAISSSALAIIFPPLLHILTFKGHGLGACSVLKDIFIISVGILGFLFGTYTSILAIIKGFENSAHIGNGSLLPNSTTFRNSSRAFPRTCKYPY